MDRKIRSQIKPFVAIVAFMASPCTLEAGSATWNLNPVNNHWNKAANWTPATVPNGPDDVATFGASNVAGVLLGAPTGVYSIVTVAEMAFEPGASAYTVTVTPVVGADSTISFEGAGMVNNSGITQNLVAANSGQELADSARITFKNTSSAGENIVITNQGSASAVPYGGATAFWDSSSAATATIINEGASVSGTIWGGFTDLLDYSSAETATFINNPGTVSGAAAGHTFVGTSPPGNIGTSTFINNAAAIPGAEGGWTEIDGGVSDGATFLAKGATVADAQGGQVYAFGGDGYSTYTAEGGNGANAQGGLIDVLYVPASTQTVVTANGGTNGGLGGTILIEDSADISLPQFQVFGNGVLDLTNVTDPTMPIGSLAGNGVVSLAGHTLSIGNNNLSTSFSGLIQDSGGVMKLGSGMLTLAGANSYTGATTVTAGTLRVHNQSGSATGTGAVRVNAGTLGGQGIISGLVTMGTGSGTGAVLAPSAGSNRLAMLTIQRALTFKADSSYSYKLNTNNPSADEVIARGVTIESGAQFSFQSLGNRSLAIGTIFTAISNTSANSIAGTFANLPDGSTFTAGRNNFQASYSGGDGNDLTLTVVP